MGCVGHGGGAPGRLLGGLQWQRRWFSLRRWLRTGDDRVVRAYHPFVVPLLAPARPSWSERERDRKGEHRCRCLDKGMTNTVPPGPARLSTPSMSPADPRQQRTPRAAHLPIQCSTSTCSQITKEGFPGGKFLWEWRLASNQGPPGYEPSELSLLHARQRVLGCGDRVDSGPHA